MIHRKGAGHYQPWLIDSTRNIKARCPVLRSVSVGNVSSQAAHTGILKINNLLFSLISRFYPCKAFPWLWVRPIVWNGNWWWMSTSALIAIQRMMQMKQSARPEVASGRWAVMHNISISSHLTTRTKSKDVKFWFYVFSFTFQPTSVKKVPWCIYPKDYGYIVTAENSTADGMTVDIMRNKNYSSSGRPDSPDIDKLRVEIRYHSGDMLQFKVVLLATFSLSLTGFLT